MMAGGGDDNRWGSGGRGELRQAVDWLGGRLGWVNWDADGSSGAASSDGLDGRPSGLGQLGHRRERRGYLKRQTGPDCTGAVGLGQVAPGEWHWVSGGLVNGVCVGASIATSALACHITGACKTRTVFQHQRIFLVWKRVRRF